MAASFTTGNSWTTGDQVTAAKLNTMISGQTVSGILGSEMDASAGIDIAQIDWTGANGDIGIVRTSTTTNILSITGSSLTTGSLGYFYSNSASTSGRYLMQIINDNSLASGAYPLYIQQDANQIGAYIHSGGNTSTPVLQVDCDTLVTGSLGYFYSNSADTSARNLVSIVNDNVLATAAVCLKIQQDADHDCLIINAVGVTTDKIINTIGDALTTGYLGFFSSNSADTSARNLVEIANDHASASGAVCLKITQDSSGQQILGTGNENLSNAGVWTDRTSTYADKTDITPLAVTGFIDKLKNLKLFEYRKKCEVYGNKQDVLSATETIPAVDEYEKDKDGKNGKLKEKEHRKTIDGVEYVLDGTNYKKVTGKEYKSVVKHANAPLHKGYILDDPSTPEELISRNYKGEIDGISNGLGVNFLLAVCQELIARVELLEK